MKDLNELRRKRGNIIEQMRALVDKADQEKRSLTPEENDQWSRMDADQEAIRLEVEREERQAKLDSDRKAFDKPPAPMPEPETRERDRANPRASEEYRTQFNDMLTRGYRPDEHRDLQADSQVGGGYLVAPEQFINQLIEALRDDVFIRQLATVIPVQKATSLGVPILQARPDDAEWTVELKTGSADTAMSFGKRELHPHPAAKRILISTFLLNHAVLPVDQIVRDQLAYKFGLTQEKAFMTGSGAGQPLGVFTASPNGIDTDRDVSAGNEATAIGADGLINAKYALKGQYQKTARWIFHRDGLSGIRKLKDGEQQYLWQPGLVADKPDTILGLQFFMSEYAPNTFTTGKYVGILGDFTFYWIADSMEFSIQVLKELYAESNQIGYIGRMECDAQPVLSEAFVRVKLA
jgi:HK97 family phage major capsid protein